MPPSDFPVTSNEKCDKYSGHERGKDYNFKEQGDIGLNKNVMLGVDVYGNKIALLTVHLKSIPNGKTDRHAGRQAGKRTDRDSGSICCVSPTGGCVVTPPLHPSVGGWGGWVQRRPTACIERWRPN